MKKILQDKKDKIKEHVLMRIATLKMDYDELSAYPQEISNLSIDEANEAITKKKASLEARGLDEDIVTKLQKELEQLNGYIRLKNEIRNMSEANRSDMLLYGYLDEAAKETAAQIK